jgi:arabinofuranosyltransferase
LDKEKEQLAEKVSFQKVQNLIIIFLILLSVVLGFLYRFIQDDAYISFIYSRNLIRGDGLTWFGNYVEGYTNFLWVIWIAVGFILKIEPVLWTQISGITFFALTVYFSWKASYQIFKSFIPALLANLLLITNYSMVCYATGGLETMMQTFFLTLIIYLYLKIVSSEEIPIKRILILISLISSLAILTRLDSIIPITILYIFILFRFFKDNRKAEYYFLLFLPVTIIIGIWFVWKLYYYGSILPNSYYVKLDDKFLFNVSGIKYIFRFFHWYMIWPFVLFGLIIHLFFKKKIDKNLIPIILIIIVWILYIYYAGGDFMEFRFFIPILPIMFIVLSFLIYNAVSKFSKPIKIILVAIPSIILIFGSFLHSKNFTGITEDSYLDSIEALTTFYGYYSENNWDRIGEVLKSEFINKDVTLAVGPVGAIVYYSEIKTIDMLGLNNKDIVGNYKLKQNISRRPGHRLIVKIDYLMAKNVNFIIGHPYVAFKGTLSNPGNEQNLLKWFFNIFGENKYPFNEITFIGIPLDDKEILIMPYLTRTHELDKLILEKKYEIKTVYINN